MLSDGYGEQMPLDQVEMLLVEKERLLQIQAAERGTGPNDWDDVLNEARLTLWEVLRKRPDAPSAYLHASSRMRITEVLTRGNWTGQPSQRGKPSVDPLRRIDRDSIDDPEWDVQIEASDRLDSILMAYHEGEILQALADLPERHRLYVVLRFWGGWTNAE